MHCVVCSRATRKLVLPCLRLGLLVAELSAREARGRGVMTLNLEKCLRDECELIQRMRPTHRNVHYPPRQQGRVRLPHEVQASLLQIGCRPVAPGEPIGRTCASRPIIRALFSLTHTESIVGFLQHAALSPLSTFTPPWLPV